MTNFWEQCCFLHYKGRSLYNFFQSDKYGLDPEIISFGFTTLMINSLARFSVSGERCNYSTKC
jgi:hypothetical protein